MQELWILDFSQLILSIIHKEQNPDKKLIYHSLSFPFLLKETGQTINYKKWLMYSWTQCLNLQHRNEVLICGQADTYFLVAKLFYDSLCLSISQSVGEMWFSRLLLEIESLNFQQCCGAVELPYFAGAVIFVKKRLWTR